MPITERCKTQNPPEFDKRIYVIGDVHGRYDLLSKILKQIKQDLKERPCQKSKLVMLGDYIDRGPKSKQVIELLSKSPLTGHEFICLRGNHEDMLLKFLNKTGKADTWLKNGGCETLKSYGVDVRPSSNQFFSRDKIKTARNNLLANMPSSHIRFINNLIFFHQDSKYLFVHAGVRPGVSLSNQSSRDLLWIRKKFLNSKTNFGKIIVHGHTPTEKPEIFFNRIGIDTGAWRSNILTCLVLEGSKRRFLMT